MCKEEILKNLEEIFESWNNFWGAFISIIIFILAIKPMFETSIISGLLLIGTYLYVFLFKTKILIESPGYAIILFGIFAIRHHIFPILLDGIKNMKNGFWIEGITFVIVWLIIYLKTKEIEN